MYYNLPLFSFNIRIWRYLGFIEYENYRRTAPVIIVIILTILFEVMDFYFIWNDMSVLIMSLFMTAIITNSLVRILVVMKNQDKFQLFMEEIAEWYTEIESGNDIVAWSVLKKVPQRTKAITYFSFIFGSLGGVLTALLPLLMDKRSHPYAVYILGLDVLKSPVYEIVYLLQVFVVMPFIVCSYIPFTNLFISWLIFGINILQVLRRKFENLPRINETEQLKRLKELIKFHKRIIRFSKTLESLVSFVCLVELLLFTLMLCVLLVFILLADNIFFQISTVLYIFCILYALFISYWHANEFSAESLNIANAVYAIDWTNSSLEVRKCVLILLVRCQSELKISAGGMYPMTLESFQALLNAAYTYFNMLRGLMAK